MAEIENIPSTKYAVEIMDINKNSITEGERGLCKRNIITQTLTNNGLLVNVHLIQKMYQPSYLEVVLQTNAPISSYERKLITLYSYSSDVTDFDTNENILVKDYYIFNIKQKGEYVTLIAYSADKFLTIDKFSQAFTARTLVGGIIVPSLSNCLSPNFEKFRQIVPQKNDKDEYPYVIKNVTNFCDIKTEKDTKGKSEKKVYVESLIPYAVQYNESFYDFMVRMCSRDGEFLYMDEENKLCIGLNPIENADKKICEVFKDAEIEYVNTYDLIDTTNWIDRNYLGLSYSSNGKTVEEKSDTAGYIHDFNLLPGNSVNLQTTCYVLAPEYLEDVSSKTEYAVKGDYNCFMSHIISKLHALGDECNILDAVSSYTCSMIHEEALYTQYKNSTNKNFEKTYKDKGVLYSTNKTIRDNEGYKEIYTKQEKSKSGQLIVITSTKPNIQLGEVIEDYVVYESIKTIIENQGTFNERYELLLVKKVDSKFYPLPKPEFSIKKASAQRAIVVDNFDPSRLGRVRVKYPWQSAADENSTPWIRISNPMASNGAGFLFTPDIHDEVLIDYEDGNIERPYVCGAFYNNTNRPSIASQSQTTGKVKSITSANGHHISFTDTGGGGRFASSMMPIFKTLSAFGALGDSAPTNSNSKYFGGGFEIADYYGIYSIKGSTHNRSISVSSPFGNVSIDAFTGITINAPLGDVKIVGKNVSIEARNNLTIESGTNIKPYLKGKKADWINKTLDVANSEFLDLSFFRYWLEAVLRPIGGIMLLKSNRYMRLEAGKGKTTIDKIEPSLTEKSNLKKFIIKGAFESEKDVIIHRVTERMNSFFSTYSATKARIEDLQTQLQGLSSSNTYVEIINSMIDDRGNVVASLTSQSYINLENSQKQILDNIRDTIGSIKESIPNNFENYKAENKVRTSYNNLLDALKDMVKSRNFQLSNIEELNKRELMYYEFKAEITGEIQDKFGIQFSRTEDSGEHNFDLQYLSSQIRQQIEEDDEKLSKGMVAAKLLGWEHFKDDKVWTTKDEGAILISDTEDSFFKIRNDGTISKHFNKKTNDVIQAIHNAGE